LKQSRKTPKITEVYRLLEAEFGEVETPLYFSKPYELAIAVILSAQCTDERVNTVTPELFRSFPTLESFANAPLTAIEKKMVEPFLIQWRRPSNSLGLEEKLQT